MEPLEVRIILLHELLRNGRLEEALTELNQLLSRFPESGRLQSINGYILFRYAKQNDAAEEAFRKAMRADGEDPELYPEYAELLLQGAKYTEMVAVLNRALEVPLVKKDVIYHLFGQLYERQQNWDEAIEYYNRAILFTLDGALMKQFLEARQRVQQKKNL